MSEIDSSRRLMYILNTHKLRSTQVEKNIRWESCHVLYHKHASKLAKAMHYRCSIGQKTKWSFRIPRGMKVY